MNTLVLEHLPSNVEVAWNDDTKRVEHANLLNARIAVNHNITLPNGEGFSPDHETTLVLGSLGMSNVCIARATRSAPYIVYEQKRHNAVSLGLPYDAPQSIVTAKAFDRDILVVDRPIRKPASLSTQDINVLTGLAQGLGVEAIDDTYPDPDPEPLWAKKRIYQLEQRLKVRLAALASYGYLSGLFPAPFPASYFSSRGEPGHELLGDDISLPTGTDISLQGPSLQVARPAKLYYHDGIINVRSDVALPNATQLTNRETTTLGLLAIGLQPSDISKTTRQPKWQVAEQSRSLCDKLGATSGFPPVIVSQAFEHRVLQVAEASPQQTCANGLAEYVQRVAHGEGKYSILVDMVHNYPQLPLILNKYITTPASAVTFGRVSGLSGHNHPR